MFKAGIEPEREIHGKAQRSSMRGKVEGSTAS